MFLGLNWKLKISNHCTKYLARHWRISFLKKYIFYKINPERFTSTGLLQRDGIYRVPIVCRNLWSQVSLAHFVKAHSHYCVFRVSLWQTVVLLHRDRKIPISVLTQSTVESANRCGECEWAFTFSIFWFFQSTQHPKTLYMPMVLVFVLKLVKSVLRCLLYIFHLSGLFSPASFLFELINTKSIILGGSPGLVVMIWRSWVRIPALYTGSNIFHIFVVKIVMIPWKDENELIRSQGWPF